MAEANRRHFLLNLITGYGNTFISMILGLVSVPIALSYWQIEKYGIWTIITSLAVYLSISGLGIDVATGLLMTKNSSRGVKSLIFKRGLISIFLASIIISTCIFLLYLIYPNWLMILGKMSDNAFVEARLTATIFIAFFLVNLPFGIFANSFAAYEKAYINSIFNFILTIMNFIVLLITVAFKFTLPIYAIMFGTTTFIVNIVKLIMYKSIIKSEIEKEQREIIDNEDTKYVTIITMGIRLTMYGVAVLISSNASNLIISNYISASDVVPYSLAYKLFYIAFTILYTFNIAAGPLLGKEFGLNNWEWIEQTYRKLFIFTVFTASIFLIGAILLFRDILFLWVGPNKYVGTSVIMVLGIWFFIGGLSNINYLIINTFNYTRGIAYVSWIEATIFISSAIILVKKIGILGVASGLLLGSVTVSLWVLPLIVYRNTNKKLVYDFKYFFENLFVVTIFCLIAIFIQANILNWFLRITMAIIGIISYLLISVKILPKYIKGDILFKIKYFSNRFRLKG